MPEHKILLADHSPTVQTLFLSFFEKSGLPEPIIVYDVDSALKAFEENEIEVYFIEFALPGQPGVDLVKTIMEKNDKAFIVMLSVAASKDNIKEAMEAGVQAVVQKPFHPSKIIELIHKYELRSAKAHKFEQW